MGVRSPGTLGDSCKGALEGAAPFSRGHEGYERKSLGMGISLYGGSDGQPRMGSSTGNFEIWLIGAVEVEFLSLWELCEGNLEREGSLAGDPEGYVEKVLETGMASIFIGAPFGEPGGGLVCWGI